MWLGIKGTLVCFILFGRMGKKNKSLWKLKKKYICVLSDGVEIFCKKKNLSFLFHHSSCRCDSERESLNVGMPEGLTRGRLDYRSLFYFARHLCLVFVSLGMILALFVLRRSNKIRTKHRLKFSFFWNPKLNMSPFYESRLEIWNISFYLSYNINIFNICYN